MNWVPTTQFDLLEVLQLAELGGLRAGASSHGIESVLGPPQAPVARLGKRSKIYSWLYGNVSVLVADQSVVSIEIDFEGERAELVSQGAARPWRLDDWRTFADRMGWTTSASFGVIQLAGPGVSVSLDETGELHTARLV